jgi:hypothetical protein
MARLPDWVPLGNALCYGPNSKGLLKELTEKRRSA